MPIVTAVSADGAAIGGGIGSGNSVTITDDAVVDARSAFAAAIGNGDQSGRSNDPTTITISGNATVHAETSQSAAPLVLVGMAAVLISRSILKKMPMLQLLLPMIILRLEMLPVTMIPQQPSTITGGNCKCD